MKKLLFGLVLATTNLHAHSSVVFFDSKLAFDAVVATQVVDNFDRLNDIALPSQFQRGDLLFTSHSGVPVIIGSQSTYYNFGSHLNPFRGTVLTTSGDEDYTIKFLNGTQRAVGFDLIANGLGPAYIDVFSAGVTVGSLVIPNIPGGGYRYVGITSDNPFDSFRWRTTAGGSLNTAIDNIALAVPEPGTWAMLLAGLAGLGFTVRRKKAILLK